MTQLEILDTNLVIHVKGADKLWALKSELTVPIQHITDATYDPSIADKWHYGIKLAGSRIPGVITAGTFYEDGEKVFWDVHVPENSLVISLRDEKYKQLIVEVEDPHEEINRIKLLLS